MSEIVSGNAARKADDVYIIVLFRPTQYCPVFLVKCFHNVYSYPSRRGPNRLTEKGLEWEQTS